MHSNTQILRDFYAAFAQRRAGDMRKYYTPNAEFSDAVFPALRGQDIGDMWEMLCASAKGFHLELMSADATDTTGQAHWEARYLFGGQRQVLNSVHSKFEFENGLIANHQDSFDFGKWSHQALGPLHTVLGWSPLPQWLVQRRAAQGLRKFQSKRRVG